MELFKRIILLLSCDHVLDYRIILKYLMMLMILISLTTTHIECMSYLSEGQELPTELEAKVGSYVVFNCPLEFPQDSPIPYSIHWNKDNKTIYTWYDERQVSSDLYMGRISLVRNNKDYGKASVNLTSIRESDQGWYECRIHFPYRTPSTGLNGTWFNLNVEGGSLIKIPPVNQTIMEGRTAFFNCVMKNPEISIIKWYKDGTDISELQDLYHRSLSGSEGTLSIDPTMMSDLGEYECIVKNLEGEEQSARAFLNIQYKAKVIYAPPEVYMPYGQEAILDCHFRSNPPLTSLRWEKDGLIFDPYNIQDVFYKTNGSIIYKKVDESHAGRYTCTPYNDLGTDGPSPIITVIVQRPPTFKITPKPYYIYKLGDDAQLSCEAIDRNGIHRPVIQWSRQDGTDLPNERYTINGGNITLENIIESDRGIYQCAATNEAGSIVAETELIIENIPPRPPYNLTANSSETEITLRWQAGYIRPNLEYVVWYRLSNSAEWRTLRIQSKHLMKADIKNLEPGREYEFMVLSQDHSGDGMFSKAFRYSTKSKEFNEPELYQHSIDAFTEIGPPKNLTITQKSDGFMVNWDSPDYGLDSLRLYVVRWWLEPGHYLHGTAETRDHHYLVKHLKEDEIYTFQVYSVSTSKYEIGSNEIEILVPSHRKMRAIAIGSTVTVIFLITAVSIYVYMKKSCRRQNKSNVDRIG